MKIIFLDIDGVLVTTNHGFDGIEEYCSDLKTHTMFDRSAVRNLNRLIEATEARIVLSSSWRTTTTTEELESILKRGGVENARVISATPHVNVNGRSHRGAEICEWLAENPSIVDYVVIDDYGQDQLSGIPEERIVQTTLKYGFGEESVYCKAVQVLQ